jgi:PAS domain S-box-containing protein
VLLFDADGRLRLNSGTPDKSEVEAVAAAIGGVTDSSEIRISAIQSESASKGERLLLQISAPIFGNGARSGRTAGALVVLLDSTQAIDPLLVQNTGRIRSGEIALIERQSNTLHFLSTLKYADAAELKPSVDTPSLPAAKAARGEQGLVEGLDYRGEPVLAMVGQVPGMPWFVISKRDREEILSPVRDVALWSGTLTALLASALGLAAYFWSRRRQGQLALAREVAGKAALAASEARFRRLIENAWDLLVLFDRDMRITYASPSVDQQVGGKMLGESIARGTALVHPEDVGRVEVARINALAHPGAPQRFEHRLKGCYDHWMTVEATFTNHFDDPDIGALAYAGRDVSERMWAEQALRDSEERYRFLFKLSPDAVFVHRNGVIFQTNDAAVRLFRAESENALIGRHWRQLVPPESRPFVEQRIALLESGEQAYLQPSEQRYLALDGQPIEVEATGARIVIDGSTAIMSVVRDISERKRAEAELKDSEARYRFLFEGSPLPMWVYDAETFAFLEVNRAAVAQYGYSRAEFLGMTLRDIRPPEDVSPMEEAARSPLPPQGRVWRHLRKDGSLIHVAIWRQPTSLSGPPTRMIVAEDVTARVEAERALRESESTLRILLDAIPGVAVITNAAGNIVFANRGFERTTGVSRENLVGVNGLSLFPPRCRRTEAKAL